MDEETRVSREAEEWGESGEARANILAAMRREREPGLRLMAIGRAMAIRQAGRLMARRGVYPSVTSLDEASADAVHGILTHVRRLDRLPATGWESARLIGVLALYAARAAYRGLNSWAVGGMTGRDSGRTVIQSLTTDLLAAMEAQDQEAITQRGVEESDHYQGARLSVVRSVYRVGVRDYMAGLAATRPAARALARRSALMRCRVVGWMVLGSPLAEAVTDAGYASVKTWRESCVSAGLWPALRSARVGMESAGVEEARVAARRWGLAAAEAIRDQRRAMTGLGALATRRVGWHDTDRQGAQSVRHGARVAPYLAYRRAVDRRATAMERARWWSATSRARAAADLAAYDRVMGAAGRGAMARLTQVVGLTDSVGRRRTGLDPSTIRRPSGTLPRRALLNDSRSLGLTVYPPMESLDSIVIGGRWEAWRADQCPLMD